MRKIIKKFSALILCLTLVIMCYPKQKISAEASAVLPSIPYTTEIVDGGVYYIRNQHSGLYLDVCGGHAEDGAIIHQYGFHGEAAQQFVVNIISNGVYEILPYLHSDKKCIDVSGGQNVNGSDTIVYNKYGAANQRYNIVPTGNNDGAFVIKTKISNETKCLTVDAASVNSGARIIQYDYFNHGSDDNDHWYFVDALVNKQINYYIEENETIYYRFYIPDANKYYTIETISDKDTCLAITLPNGEILEDDDSGEDYNASLGFSVTYPGYVDVALCLYDDNDEGFVDLSIFKQQAVFYSYFTETNDLLGNVYDASEYSRVKYNSLVYLDDVNYVHATSPNERFYKRINSEVFVFSGHGFYDPNALRYGFAVKFGNDNDANYFRIEDLPELSNVKIALWSSCYSSNSNNQYGQSFASQSVLNGAKCSIGFEGSVYISSLVSFTNNFFYYLYNGHNVQTAASYAANLLPANDIGRNYEIFGDLNTKLIDANVNYRNVGSFLSLEEKLLIETLKDDENYLINDLGNIKQYFKKVNGLPTTTYYSVYYENNQPIKIEESKNENVDRDVRPVKYSDIDLNHYGIKIESSTSNKYYHDFGDGYYTPIEVVQYTYGEKMSDDNFISTSKVVCKNLYNGQLFDYEILLNYYSSL